MSQGDDCTNAAWNRLALAPCRLRELEHTLALLGLCLSQVDEPLFTPPLHINLHARLPITMTSRYSEVARECRACVCHALHVEMP